jgi:hypothetical protein
LLLASACSEPPQKEIDHAQGALDAARAAGADQYAQDAFTAATSALQQAHDAVQQRDYKLALTRAVDANERAQEAARQAADGKAAARSRSEALLHSTASALDLLQGRIKAAETVRAVAKDLQPVRKAADDAASAMQEARAEVTGGRYLQASETLEGLRSRITAQIRAVEQLTEARTAKPSRPQRRR